MKKSSHSDQNRESRLAGIGAEHCPHSITKVEQWLNRYDEYLGGLLGLADTTRQRYLFFASRFLRSQFGFRAPDWSKLNGTVVVEFVRREAGRRKNTGRRAPVTALRSFLRFLVSEGLIATGLEGAIPGCRQYRHASLPVHLSDDQVTQVLDSCRGNTPIGLRNPILLLLSRLAMRAKEVIALRLEDIDWIEGTLKIRSSKSLRERSLPLTKDVGQALVKYLRCGRPKTPSRFVFLQHNPPLSTLI